MSEDKELQDAEELEIQVELTSPSEDVYTAYTSLLAVDGIDTGLLEDKDEFDYKIQMIRQFSINVIYENMKYINDYTIADASTE